MAGRTRVQTLRFARGSATLCSAISRQEQPRHPLRASRPHETPAPPCNSSRCGRAAFRRSEPVCQYKFYLDIWLLRTRSDCTLLRAHADRRWSRLVTLLPALGSRELLRRAAGCLLIVFGIRLGSYVPLADVDLLAMPEMQQGSAPPQVAVVTPTVLTVRSLAISYPVSVPVTVQQSALPVPNLRYTLALGLAKPARPVASTTPSDARCPCYLQNIKLAVSKISCNSFVCRLHCLAEARTCLKFVCAAGRCLVTVSGACLPVLQSIVCLLAMSRQCSDYYDG